MDIGDVEGDAATGIITLPVLLSGAARGRTNPSRRGMVASLSIAATTMAVGTMYAFRGLQHLALEAITLHLPNILPSSVLRPLSSVIILGLLTGAVGDFFKAIYTIYASSFANKDVQAAVTEAPNVLAKNLALFGLLSLIGR